MLLPKHINIHTSPGGKKKYQRSNSLAPEICGNNFKSVIFKPTSWLGMLSISNKLFPQMNATGPRWWLVKTDTGKGLVPSNKPHSKVNGANMGPTWVLSAPDGPHVCPMNLAIKQQAIAWVNVDLDLCCHMPSVGQNWLVKTQLDLKIQIEGSH